MSPDQARYEAFVAELKELCAKHGLVLQAGSQEDDDNLYVVNSQDWPMWEATLVEDIRTPM